jgi:hypothetical protein
MNGTLALSRPVSTRTLFRGRNFGLYQPSGMKPQRASKMLSAAYVVMMGSGCEGAAL